MGKTREGECFCIIVNLGSAHCFFCYYDGGEKGYILCLSGRRESGFWITLVWLISKSYANMAGKSWFPIPKMLKDS